MTRFASTGDAVTAYTVNGEGPPLLLMHGAEADKRMFDELAGILAGRFTVIAYDQRDCGATQAPEVPATFEQLARDAKLLIASLGFDRVHVFGSSFGSRIAQALAILHPQCVDRLVLGSGWALPLSLADLNPAGRDRMVELRRGLPASAADLARFFFPEPFLAQRPALLNYFATVTPSSERSVRRSAVVGSTLDVALSRIQARTLLIAGDSDLVVPSRLTFDMGLAIEDTQTLLLAGVGHATCLQVPAQVAAGITAFIDDLPNKRLR